MKDFTFWVPIQGSGDNAQEAWENAMEAFTMAPPANHPAPVFGKDEPVPAAEILGGNLDAGFTLDHGEEPEPEVAWSDIFPEE